MDNESPTISGFLVDVVDDPARLRGYLEDREGALASAGLTEEQQRVLRSDDAVLVRRALASELGRGDGAGERPTVYEPSPDEPPPDEPKPEPPPPRPR